MNKIKIGFILILALSVQLKAQDNVHISKLDSITVVEKYVKKQQFKSSLRMPALLIGGGLFALTDNEIFSSKEIAEERNEVMPNFRVHADDYLQYAPIAAVYGLNIVGVKGKNNFGNRTAILLKSEIIMTALVFPTKSLTHTLRPDGSAHTSFPSGHTAQAFVAATFMHKEYGHLSTWYSIGAYATAASVGALRILNNKHYASDVLVGAGIGILATNLAYLTHQYKWSGSKKKRNNLLLVPSYYQGSVGFNMNIKL